MSETKDWCKICADCNEGEPPKDCEYYGEPNGCNSPTYGKHPTCKDSLQVGDMAEMLTALEEVVSILSTWIDHLPPVIQEKAQEAIDKAEAALAKPPRNCDVYATKDERQSAFINWYNEVFDLKGSKNAIGTCDLKHNIDDILHEYIDWLFEEAKGEAK